MSQSKRGPGIRHLFLYEPGFLEQQRDAGKTIRDIAHEFGVGSNTVWRATQRMGVVFSRKRGAKYKYPQLADAEGMRRRYEAGGSLSSIARGIGCDVTSVINALDNHGIRGRMRLS